MDRFRPKNWRYVYCITDGMGNFKIGIANHVVNRMRELQSGNPNELQLLGWAKLDEEARAHESWCHERFAIKRLCGEWFELSESDLECLKQHPAWEFPTLEECNGTY